MHIWSFGSPGWKASIEIDFCLFLLGYLALKISLTLRLGTTYTSYVTGTQTTTLLSSYPITQTQTQIQTFTSSYAITTTAPGMSPEMSFPFLNFLDPSIDQSTPFIRAIEASGLRLHAALQRSLSAVFQ
jgi:hypothetical protein